MKKLLFVSCLLLGIQATYAQISIGNVKRSVLRGADAIKEGTDVNGYYFFYASDKVDRKTN